MADPSTAVNFLHGRSFSDNPDISQSTVLLFIKCDFAANLKSPPGKHLPLVYVLRDGEEMERYISNLQLWPRIFFEEDKISNGVTIPKDNVIPAEPGQSVKDWLATFSREDPDVGATRRLQRDVR